MLFSKSWSEPRYIRRTRAYLQEARMAMLEHSIAAENYRASAAMYEDRIKRLELEIAHWEAVQRGETVSEPVSIEREDMKPSHVPHVAPVGVVRVA